MSVSDTASALQAVASFQYVIKSSCASTWIVKEPDISKDEWPVAVEA